MQTASAVQKETDMDHLTVLAEARTSYDVFRVIKDFSIKSNFKKFMIMRLPDGEESGIADLAIITNWDPELIGGYDSMGLVSDSPIFQALKKSTLPFVWRLDSVNYERSDGNAKATIDLFLDFEIENGVYFHVSGPAGQRGTLGLAGKRPDPTQQELMSMSYIASHAFEVLCNLDIMQSKNVDTLTEREKECIYWTACGKTSSEVGTILAISDNTVNNYLASAAMKLDTANKAHTVAKAIRYGLLDNF